jgi:hypothetical protein
MTRQRRAEGATLKELARSYIVGLEFHDFGHGGNPMDTSNITGLFTLGGSAKLAQYSRDPILAYLPKTRRNTSTGIGRPPRWTTAVPGRTALSRLAIGSPFGSNLTALPGE